MPAVHSSFWLSRGQHWKTFFFAPGTPAEPPRPPRELQLLTQPAAAEPARHRGGASRSRTRRSRTTTPPRRCRRPSRSRREVARSASPRQVPPGAYSQAPKIIKDWMRKNFSPAARTTVSPPNPPRGKGDCSAPTAQPAWFHPPAWAPPQPQPYPPPLNHWFFASNLRKPVEPSSPPKHGRRPAEGCASHGGGSPGEKLGALPATTTGEKTKQSHALLPATHHSANYGRPASFTRNAV